MEQNSGVFIDEGKNTSSISATSVTAKLMKGVTDGVSFGSVGVTSEGTPLDSAWESLLLFPCPLVPSRSPRMNRICIFKMEEHQTVYYETS